MSEPDGNEHSTASLVVRWRNLKRRVAPRESDAIQGSIPNSGSSSECHDILSFPFRYRFAKVELNIVPANCSLTAFNFNSCGVHSLRFIEIPEYEYSQPGSPNHATSRGCGMSLPNIRIERASQGTDSFSSAKTCDASRSPSTHE